MWVDVQTRHLLSNFSSKAQGQAQLLNFSNDGRLALVKRGAFGKTVTVELWKRAGKTAALKWSWATKEDASAAVFVRGGLLIHRGAVVWTLDWNGHKIKHQKIEAGYKDSADFSQDGRFLWAYRLYDLKKGRSSVDVPAFTNASFSPSGHFIIVSWISMLNDMGTWVFDTRNGQSVRTNRQRNSSAAWDFDSVWAPDETLSPDLSILPLRFYNLKTGKESRFRAPQPWGNSKKVRLRDVQFSRAGKTMAALRSDGHIWLVTPTIA